jgi:NTE family protein
MGQKVHLVLGCGGARGIAHIGVIETLEEAGYEIRSIAGCSMGAVVGGIHAAGHLKTYKEWMLTLTKSMVFEIMDFTMTRQGFLKGERIFDILEKMTGPQQIEEMKITFTAVSADMIKNEEIHFTSGDLYKALRSSIGIPGLFTPVVEDGRFLVDGGVLNPLPLNLVSKNEGEWIIAVNLNGSTATNNVEPITDENQEAISTISKWINTLTQKIKSNGETDNKAAEYSLTDLLRTSYNMTQDRLTQFMLEKIPPDILIEIPRNTCNTFDFHKAEGLIALGRKKCLAAIS